LESLMKLLSMRVGGENHAGVVIGDNVLDVTAFLAARPEGEGQGVKLEDALDLYNYGIEAVRTGVLSEVERDESLARRCRQLGILMPISEALLGPPVLRPGKILGVGLNYAAHAAENNVPPPETPLIFSKCATALAGPEDPIRLPRASDQVDYEAELAVVIGRPARGVEAASALGYVAGYAVMNDVTARDLQRRERQWTRAKGLDTFAPCGPWLVTADEIADPHGLAIELRLNGELRQSSNTDDMIFKVAQLIEFVSQDLTLLAGDIITTGTPSGVGVYSDPPRFLRHGDRIEITIERIGTLRNAVEGRRD
jgi:2-keto-4-pentenoate hydratase/2-oxohepta-3-ene-1,7-dioic acid hydratase in catechol pathway